MPGLLKIKINSAVNLPIMDKTSESTDAFVEIKVAQKSFKTEIVKRSLNPVWNSEWYTVELDDRELFEETLFVKVMDHDTYTADDLIGRVIIDIDTLLDNSYKRVITSFFAIHNPASGVCGEISLSFRLDLFHISKQNHISFHDIEFFHSCCIPDNYEIEAILGLVSASVSEDPSDNQMMDKLRRSKSANDTKLRSLSRLRGTLKRKLAAEAAKYGSNAVVGFNLHFDMTSDRCTNMHATGTAILMSRKYKCFTRSATPSPSFRQSNEGPVINSEDQYASMNSQTSSHIHSDVSLHSFFKNRNLRRCVSLGASRQSGHQSSANYLHAAPSGSQLLEYSEFPFLTITSLHPGCIIHFGSLLSAKSVKLGDSSSYSGDLFASWWKELRVEIHIHMKMLLCSHVIGYCERLIRCDDVLILSASGTAVKLDINKLCRPVIDRETMNAIRGDRKRCTSSGGNVESQPNSPRRTAENSLSNSRSASPNNRERTTSRRRNQTLLSVDVKLANSLVRENSPCREESPVSGATPCQLCHVPYNPLDCDAPNAGKLVPCGCCNMQLVPEILLATGDIPDNLSILGFPALITTSVSRPRKESRGESAAKEISEMLPFLEYDLHQSLIQKLKVNGMNAAFGLKTSITFNSKLVLYIAMLTGVHITALPIPLLPQVSLKSTDNESTENIKSIQEKLQSRVKHIRDIHKVPSYKDSLDSDVFKDSLFSSGEGSPDDNLNSFNGCTQEIDPEDVDKVTNKEIEIEGLVQISTRSLPTGSVITPAWYSQHASQKSARTFLRIFQRPLNQERHFTSNRTQSMNQENYSDRRSDVKSILDSSIRTTAFQMRSMLPCLYANLCMKITLPDDGLRVLLSGTCLSWPSKFTDDEKDENIDNSEIFFSTKDGDSAVHLKCHPRQAIDLEPHLNDRHCFLCSLPTIPGCRVISYIGDVSMFVMRETTSLNDFNGVSGFLHCCLSEMQLLLNSYTLALKGNALLSYTLSEPPYVCVTGRNQAFCLIHVCGDRVLLEDNPCSQANPSPFFQEHKLDSYE